MPKFKSFLEISQFEIGKLERLFSIADEFATQRNAPPNEVRFMGQTAALIFFEASTRTRMSFEAACALEGLHPILLDIKSGSSLEKGETFEDTVLNVAAMDPSLMIIRCGDQLDLQDMDQKVSTPILNAGWGKKGHPTQALLDAYTIRRFRKNLKGERLLIVGDVVHSRVASSHFQLAKLLGYEIALCGPRELLPEDSGSYKIFSDLKSGLKWATAVMALRMQVERHQGAYSASDLRIEFGLNSESLKDLDSKAIIMHPGPINQGVELEPEVLIDPRSVVLEQVRSGVWVRRALVRMALSGF